jgi:hypothetical protein
MELNKVLTATEQAHDIMRQHYIENYSSYAMYDMNNAKKNALITVKLMSKQYRELYKKLVAGGLLKGEIEDSSTYKYLEEMKEYINNFKAKELE